MSTLDPGHPVGFIFRRETKDIIPGWRPMVDRSFIKSKNLFRKNLYAHFGCVNAVEFSRDGNLLASGGDDRRILLWNVDKAIHGNEEPTVMQAEHGSNVFALALDNSNRKIFSAGNDDQVIVHDVETSVPLDYFVHEQPVYGVSIDPLNDCIFASACDDGRLLIYDIREPSTSDPFCLANLASAFHAVMFHPTEPRLIVSGNSKEGVALWDVRKPKTPLLRYGGLNADQCCMSARFNSDGSKILALRRRLPPVLYATRDTGHLFQFNHTGYYNSCTMKSCSFAGTDDQFVLSGSDNFDLYMWRIPPEGSDRWVDEAHLILRGHRSIVNQVRYSKVHSVIVSSGVEKLIKVWSPFSFNCSKNYASHSFSGMYEKERRIYSHTEYINLVTQSGQFMSLTYDTTRKSTREDPRMMAFFDALVQRDIEGWSDDSDNIAENSYAIVSEVESTPSEDSTDSEDDSLVTNHTAVVSSSGNSETSRSNNTFETSSGNLSLVDRQDELVFDNSESEDVPTFEDGALILSQSSFHTQEFPNHSTQEPGHASAEEDDQFKRNYDPDSDFSQPIVNDGNIIKELISRKHERLRQLARAHVILESTLKKPSPRKRKTMYSSTSSSESSSNDDEDARANMRNTGAEFDSTINSVASTSASLFSPTNSAGGAICRTHSQVSSHDSCSKRKPKRFKSCSSAAQNRVLTKKNFLKNFKRLRYEKKSSNGESKSGNFCSYFCKTSGRYQHAESNSSSSSETDDDKPRGKSASNLTSERADNSSSTSSSSSSSSSASDSSSDTDQSSSNRHKPRPCSSPNLISKTRNPGSSESNDDDVVDESLNGATISEDQSTECSQAVVARLQNSPAFKLSPLIRRIEIERLRKIQRLERRKAGGNHFSTRNNATPARHMLMDRTCTSSSSGASSNEASDDKKNATQNIRKQNDKFTGQKSSASETIVSVTLTESNVETPLRNFMCSEPDLVEQEIHVSNQQTLLSSESPLPECSIADPTSDYDSELHTINHTSSPGFSTSCGQSTTEDD